MLQKCFLSFFQAHTVFVVFFIRSHEPIQTGLQKWLFQGGNREILFFKEVQLLSNLHSETNYRKWLMPEKKKKSETGFRLIYAKTVSLSWRKGEERPCHGGSQTRERQPERWNPLGSDSADRWLSGGQNATSGTKLMGHGTRLTRCKFTENKTSHGLGSRTINTDYFTLLNGAWLRGNSLLQCNQF